MNTEIQTGLYGKLPAYGDFIFRNLNSSFISPWDEWLQHFISVSQEQIGEQWLDIYLTSPIWRFSLSPGVIDNRVWAGVMMPSVDRVGRYFPISVVTSFGLDVSPVAFMLKQQQWFESVEQQCLNALDGSIDADQLVASINEIPIDVQEPYVSTYNLGDPGPIHFSTADSNEVSMNQLMPYMLNAVLSSSLSSFSVWQTSGSDLVCPCVFSCQGLPPIGSITSMLDGQWHQRDWKLPYNMRLV